MNTIQYGTSSFDGTALFFQLINLALLLGFLVLGLYCAVLFIKLARRGIRALDIYIKNHSDESLKK